MLIFDQSCFFYCVYIIQIAITAQLFNMYT